MEKSKMSESNPYKLLQLVWGDCNRSPIFSWERLNSSMHTAALLAIDSGMWFDLDDFNKIAVTFRMGYWANVESLYAQAVKSNNMSACHALENTMNRKPFIAKFPINSTDQGKGRRAYRKEGRLALGSSFIWDGNRVEITSFAKDGESFIACGYYNKADHVRLKRYRITRRDLHKLPSSKEETG
jgi:hypothetical protein